EQSAVEGFETHAVFVTHNVVGIGNVDDVGEIRNGDIPIDVASEDGFLHVSLIAADGAGGQDSAALFHYRVGGIDDGSWSIGSHADTNSQVVCSENAIEVVVLVGRDQAVAVGVFADVEFTVQVGNS